MEDLNAASVKDVQDFFRTYYAPNNAILTVVGDIRPEETMAKIKKYFGTIPSQPPPPVPDMTEPPQKEERRKTLEDQFARTPRVDMVYKIPRGNTDDWYALSILGNILGSGQSSRLYQALVKDKQLAVNVFSAAQDKRGPSLFNVVVLAQPGKDLTEVEKTTYSEIDRIKKEPVAGWEIEKAGMNVRRQNAQQLQGTLFRAFLIGQMTVYYGDPNLINTRTAKLQAVTKEDIQRVARQYLVDTGRTVITTIPKPKTVAVK
jgi:predicted Zn-dependent peptidase